MAVIEAALLAASSKVVLEMVPYIKGYIDGRIGREKTDQEKQVQIGESLQVDASSVIVRDLEAGIRQGQKKADNTIALSRIARNEGTPQDTTTGILQSGSTSTVTQVALAVDPMGVFRDARRRIELVFRLNLGIAVTLATILVGGIGAAVVSGIVFKNPAWSVVFGGISAADVLGVYVFKPLKAINSALLDAQRLDGIYLRVYGELSSCSQLKTLKERIECQSATYTTMQKELAALAQLSTTTDSKG